MAKQEIKKFWQSKTFWINVLVAISAISADISGYLSTTDAASITVLALGNVALRAVTRTGIRLK